MPEYSCATRNFSGQWGGGRFVELGHFNESFVKNSRKKGSTGKHFVVFYLDTLKTTSWMENLIHRMTQSGPKSGHFFDFQKTQRRPR